MEEGFGLGEMPRQCFKKLPERSSNFEQKLSSYWKSAGDLRQSFVNENWHMLPVLKGKFYQHPKLKQSLAGLSEAEKAREEERRRKIEAAKKKEQEVEPLASEPEVSYATASELFQRLLQALLDGF